MCGRFEVLTYEEVAEVVAAVEGRAARVRHSDSGGTRAQARPGSQVLAFGRETHEGDRGHEGGPLRIMQPTWGFEAPWGGKPVFNTRIESALSGAALWRGPVRDGRCVIPAAAFYEPHGTETVRSPRTGRPMKRPYRFALPDGAPVLFAGVQEGGRCSVVTCEPNRWVAPVHDRMPLVLRFEEVLTWLSPEWPALADRSGVELVVFPEELSTGDDSKPSGQLSLF